MDGSSKAAASPRMRPLFFAVKPMAMPFSMRHCNGSASDRDLTGGALENRIGAIVLNIGAMMKESRAHVMQNSIP